MYEETIAGLRKIVRDCKGRLTPWMRVTIAEAADAIEELAAENKEIVFRANQLEAINDALYGETGACDAIIAAREANRWIPATERLPEAAPGDVSERVLVTDGKDVAIVEWFNFEEFEPFWGYTGFGKDVTHWMPLPSTEGLNET